MHHTSKKVVVFAKHNNGLSVAGKLYNITNVFNNDNNNNSAICIINPLITAINLAEFL